MKPSLSLFLAGVALAAALPASAQTRIITFDAGDPINGLAVGATLANQYAAFGATFSPNAFSGPGTSSSGENWATNTNLTVVSSTGSDVGGLGLPSLVSGNLLRSFNGWLGENGDPSFRISFGSAVTFFSAAFAGVSAPADVHLFIYSGSNLLSSVTSAVTTGQFTLSYTGSGITSVVVTPGSFDDWVGVDNITYTLASAVVPVPEPGTYALMGLGLGALAWARRRAASRA